MEELIKHKPIIEILAAIGTFISALVALYTLLEIKKQRKSTYKPELFLDSFFFELATNPFFVEEEKLMKFKNNVKGNKKSKKRKDESIYVNYYLENLGFGFAKLIECKWEFDFEKAIKELKKIAPKNIEWSQILEYTSMNFENGNHDSFNYNELKVQKIDFIAPDDKNSEKKSETFPHCIIKIYVYYLIFKHNLYFFEAKNFHYEYFKSLPNIKLKLSYKDLNGELYRKSLILEINAFSTQIEEIMDCTKNVSSFVINVKE